MITPEQVAIYRCPIDPGRQARLALEDDVRLRCEHCSVRFRVRDGLPCLVPEDAILPDGCSRIEELSCRSKK